MIIIAQHEQVEKLAKLGKKVEFFVMGARNEKLTEEISAQALGVAPVKELVEAYKATDSKKEKKRQVKKYVKMALKGKTHTRIGYMAIIDQAIDKNLVPVIVFEEGNEEHDFYIDCLQAFLKKLGIKLGKMKDLKKAGVFKGKKKDRKKALRKFMDKFNYDEEAYPAYVDQFRFDNILLSFNSYIERKDVMNKKTRKNFLGRLFEAMNEGSKKFKKKQAKNFKKVYDLLPDLDKIKKLEKKQRIDTEELSVVLTHMALIQFSDYLSDEYIKEFKMNSKVVFEEATVKELESKLKSMKKEMEAPKEGVKATTKKR